MEKFIERLLEEDIKFEKDVNNGLSDINIFDALNIETKENYHSKFIAYLIDNVPNIFPWSVIAQAE